MGETESDRPSRRRWIGIAALIASAVLVARFARHESDGTDTPIRSSSPTEPIIDGNPSNAGIAGAPGSDGSTKSAEDPVGALSRTETPIPVRPLAIRCERLDGSPVEGASIWLLAAASIASTPGATVARSTGDVDVLFSDAAARHEAMSVTSDSQGAATLDLRDGEWFAIARSEGHPASVRRFTTPAVRSVLFAFDLPTGIDGLVIDGITKAPIAGARIDAVTMASRDEAGDPLVAVARFAAGRSAVSDGDGLFRLDGVEPGKLEVRIAAVGYPEAVAYPSGTDVRLVVELRGSAHAIGVVVDENGAPVAGVGVEVWLRGKFPPTLAAKTETNTGGEFALDELPDGAVTIAAKKRGFGISKVQATLSAASSVRVEIEIGPEAPLNGIVVDENGRVLEGAEVSVIDRDLDAEVGRMATEPDGSWYMLWLAPKHRTDVIVAKAGFHTEEVDAVPLVDAPLRIALRRLGRLFGRVVDEDGASVSHCSLWTDVALRTVEEDVARAQDAPWTEIGADGEFDFSTLLPCDYVLRFAAEGFLDRVIRYPRSLGCAPNPEAVIVTLTRGASIVGRVVDDGGRPIAGARVGVARQVGSGRLVAPSGALGVVTSIDGTFMLGGISSGAFDVTVEVDGYGTMIGTDLRLSDFPRDFVMRPPGRIVGRIASPWRDPSSVLEARLRARGTWIGRSLPIGSDSSFDSGPIAPGRYELSIIDRWARSETDSMSERASLVDLDSGETKVVDFALTGTATLRGIVRDEAERFDIRSMLVEVARADSPDVPIAMAQVQSDHRFGIPGLDPGRYVVTLELGRPGTLARMQREVEVGDSVSDDVVFEPGSIVQEGVVTDAAGEPLAAVVTLLDPGGGGSIGAVRTDAEGRYRIIASGLKPAVDWVWVRAAGFAEECSQRFDPEQAPGALFFHRLQLEARLELVVVDDRGRTIPGAVTTLEMRARPAVLPALVAATDGGGTTRFSALAPGLGTVAVRARGHVESPVQSVSIDRGATRRVIVVLARLASVDVHVVRSDDDPVSGVVVELRSVEGSGEGGSPKYATTVHDGSASFVDLKPGLTSIRIEGTAPVEFELAPAEKKHIDVPLD